MTATPVDRPLGRLSAPKRVRLMPLVALIFFSVSGGAYGIEGLFSASGPGMAIVLIIVTPLIYSIPHSLVVAELGTAIPVEGGYYHWVKRGLGKFWGFQQGVLQWICSFVDMALYPVLFTTYLQSLVGAVAPGKHVLFSLGHLRFDLSWFICLAVIVVFTLLNLLGAGWVGESSVLFAIICLTPMLILTVVGVSHLIGHGINPVSTMTASNQSMWHAFGAGLFIVMWNYSGWDSVSNVAGEMENPRKHLPKALGMAVTLIVVGYLLPSLAALSVGAGGDAGWQGWAAGSFSDVAKVLAGPWLQVTVTVGGMFAAVAMFSALLASNSRLPLVLAQDGYFPSWVAKESRRYQVPIVSIIGSSVIYALFCLNSFTNLVIFDVFLTNLGILLEVAALIALRIREPQLERPYRIPGGWFSIAAIVLLLTSVCSWAAWQQYSENGSKAVLYAVGIVAGTVVLYFPLAYRRARNARRAVAAPVPDPATVAQ
ncbi:APC family permease [Kitasatospora viridis]|uniref:Amino acid/polyamine/organocation transporter (APC superfamily) n=1 Tax=Kitasatospora viridis TaxID=281105 RepID=A0A561T6W9_9ACTN|nr:APC family permease [Kitasatospora viridis]TWF82847.1 amino acid/polyamine/organocation transporter (APC superfamily) [Kitasatospora viridis]